jgi:hypothetical protein
LSGKYKTSYYIQTGDFNMNPRSSTYEIFKDRGLISSQGAFWGRKAESKRWMEPYPTFHTDKLQDTVDYIWTTLDFTCIGACDLFSKKKSPIPDPAHCSDHVPIGSVIAFGGEDKNLNQMYPNMVQSVDVKPFVYKEKHHVPTMQSSDVTSSLISTQSVQNQSFSQSNLEKSVFIAFGESKNMYEDKKDRRHK